MPKETPPFDADPANTAVLAAGAVLWRSCGDSPEVAVIHRPRYDDWSLPKGKVDPGETEPVTAVREVYEETGYRSQLGRRLASVSYPWPRELPPVAVLDGQADEPPGGRGVEEPHQGGRREPVPGQFEVA